MTQQRVDLAFRLPPRYTPSRYLSQWRWRGALLSGNYIALLEALRQVGELTRMLGAR